MIRRLLFALILALTALPASATVTQLIGNIVDAAGNPITGTGCFRLPVNAVDTSLNRALSPRLICFPLSNGTFPAFANLTPNDVIQPANTYYQFTAFDQANHLVFMANYVIPTGAGTFNLGLAVPTSITTTNISYLSQQQVIGTPIRVIKKGSGAANYTESTGSFVNVDGTNLLYTVTIPVGWKLSLVCHFSGFSTDASANLQGRIFDTVGNTVLDYQNLTTGSLFPSTFGYTLMGLITGDGLSHTVSLQFAATVGSHQVNITNNGNESPKILFDLSPAN
jgi:hypothetical protein